MQSDLFRPGFLDRQDLRTRQVGAEKVVRDRKASVAVTFQQMEPRIAPEVTKNRAFLLKVNRLNDLRLLISCLR